MHRDGVALPLDGPVVDPAVPTDRTPPVALFFTMESDWSTLIIKDIVERVQLLNNCCPKPTGRVRGSALPFGCIAWSEGGGKLWGVGWCGGRSSTSAKGREGKRGLVHMLYHFKGV